MIWTTITIYREKNDLEYPILVEAWMDKGKLQSVCFETVKQRINTGWCIEDADMILEIDGELFDEGCPITLGEMEIEDAMHHLKLADISFTRSVANVLNNPPSSFRPENAFAA